MAEAADESGKVGRVTGISSMAMHHALAELGEAYQWQSGQGVDIVAVGGVDAARRVDRGEVFDFVVLAANAIEQLASNGRVDPGSRTDLARSGVAIAIAAGAPRPDASAVDPSRHPILAGGQGVPLIPGLRRSRRGNAPPWQEPARAVR